MKLTHSHDLIFIIKTKEVDDRMNVSFLEILFDYFRREQDEQENDSR